MAHLVIFYDIFILVTLLFSFNIPVFIFLKTRDKFLGHYILFFLPFILYTMSLTAGIYLLANLKIVNLFFFILNYLSEFFFVLMMTSVVYFCHYLFSVKQKKIKNIILLIVSLFLMFLIPFNYSIKTFENNIVGFKHNYAGAISTIVFIIILIYFVFVGIRNYRLVSNINIKKIAKTLIITLIIFFPGILLDFYNKISELERVEYITGSSIKPPFLLHPIFYTIISIMCTYFIVKYYFREYQIDLNDIPLDSLIKKYNISTREKEVMSLLINGRSNKEIADSLFISVNTVKTHIKNIYEKIGIKSRYELLTLAKNF